MIYKKKYGKWSNYEDGMLDFYENENWGLGWVLDHKIKSFYFMNKHTEAHWG